MSLAAKLFKKYDIRGNAEQDFSSEDTLVLGQAIGTYLHKQQQSLVYIGRDNRLSSERLRNTLSEGLATVGLTIMDLGVISTPTLYWYAVRNQAAGIMITGSHLDKEFNGFKLCIGNHALHSEALQEIYRLYMAGQFPKAAGKIELVADRLNPYLEEVSRKITLEKKLKVAVDPGNGTATLYTIPLFSDLWQQDLSCINMELDGNFPNHSPDPQKKANLEQLKALVLQEKADIGLIFDGDADRVGVVDETGEMIQPDRLLALLAKDVLSRHHGATIIGDVTCSQALFDVIEAHGGNGIIWMTGHSLIKEKMLETKAILAGEISGHIFFSEDYYGFDDAYLAAGKLLQLLCNSSKKLSELNAEIPSYYSTRVYRLACDLSIVPKMLDALKAELQGKAELNELDGIRAKFENGWFILRSSNTEAVLSIRIEGKTKEDAAKYRDFLADFLSQFSEISVKELRESL